MALIDKNFLNLESINAYVIADKLSDFVWENISGWDWFNKRTLGVQYVNATDSIGGNVAEGFGRYHKKDKQKFYYNARGSVYESIYWTKKAQARKLLIAKDFDYVISELNKLPREINWLIKITGEKLTE